MKKILIIGFLGICIGVSAQKPYWIKDIPKAGGKNYYYRVTQAEGTNFKEAYVEAFSMAVLESSWKLGVSVDTHETMESMKKKVSENISVQRSQVKIAINKVCEYSESLTAKRGVKVYILWQVARFGNVNPDFDDFNMCR